MSEVEGLLVLEEGPVVRLVLNRPKRRNAITAAMWQAIAQAVAEASARSSCRCIVLSGAGDHFAVGADITEFMHLRGTVEGAMHYHRTCIAPALDALAQSSKPTVAVIQGDCVGGGFELALCCDVRIATTAGRMGIPIKSLGFPMAPDELGHLVAALGPLAARELLIRGTLVGAPLAHSRGWISECVDPLELQRVATEEIGRLVDSSPLAVKINKQLIRRLSAVAEPLSAKELAEAFSYADSSDHHEGIAAFLEHRSPRFKGSCE